MGGAQEYFGVRADLVTYGKTLGGGLPIGAVCGRRELMRRFRDDRPADICFARGTFNSHPYVMGAMNEFLRFLETPECQALYDGLDDTWNARAEELNARLRDADLPVQVANISSIWTVCYTRAVSLQLDAAILPARRGAGVELGRHRPADFQHQLHGRRFCRRGGPVCRRGHGHEAGRLVLARSVDDQHIDQANDSQGDARPSTYCLRSTASPPNNSA